MTIEHCRTHQTFGAMLAVLAQPALLLDAFGRVVSANATFQARFENLAPARFSDLLQPADKPLFEAFVRDCLDAKTGPAPDFDCVVQLGAAIVGLTVSPLVVEGQVLGLLCQSKDTPAQEDVMLQYLRDHVDQGVWDYDTRTKTFVVSQTWLNMRGLTRDDHIKNSNNDWLNDIHPDDRTAVITLLDGQAKGDTRTSNIQYRHRHSDGHWFWVLCSSKVMSVDKNGQPTRIIGTDTDITELRRTEANLNQLAEKLRLAVDASGIGIWEFDPNTGTVFWDDTMLEIYGLDDGINYRSGELWETYLHPDDLTEMVAYADHCQKNGLDFSRDYRVIHSSGETRHIRSRASQIAVPGQLPKLIGANIDVTEDYQRAKALEAAQAQLLHDANHDALTGLANRRRLDDVTTTFFENVPDDQVYAAMQLDLDHFKAVNDGFGHAAGDKVLVDVARHLSNIIAQRGIVSRTGGDEFTIFFETAPDADIIDGICQSIIDRVAAPILFKNTHCTVGVSIGYALGKGPDNTPSDVFIKADRALYAAKSAGRNCFRAHASSRFFGEMRHPPCAG